MKLLELFHEFSFMFFLLEDKKEFLMTKNRDKLELTAKEETGRQMGAEEVMVELVKVDPTTGSKNLQFVVNMYLKKQFKLADVQDVNKLLTKFEQLKQKITKKDLNGYKTLDEVRSALEQFTDADAPVSKKQQKRTQKLEGVEIIIEEPGFVVMHLKTEEASKLYGKGTTWCTAGEHDCAFQDYTRGGPRPGPLYQINAKIDGVSRKFLFHYENGEFNDETDNPPSKKDINALSKFPGYAKFLNMMIKKHYGKHQKLETMKMNLYNFHANPESLDGYHEASEESLTVFWDKYKNKPAELKKKEAAIAKDPYYAYMYAERVLKGPFPAGEAAIAKDPEYALAYAENVLKGPFPAGEAAIAKEAFYAYLYAKDVLKGRWPACEPAIAKDALYAYLYAKDVLKGRWPAGEPAIAKDARWAHEYARDVLEGKPFHAGEPAIAKNPKYAYEYARDVLKGPFPAGEAALAKEAYYAQLYAKDVLKGKPWSTEM